MLEFHCLVKVPLRLWDLIYACSRKALPSPTFPLHLKTSTTFSLPSPLLFLFVYLIILAFRLISNVYCPPTNSGNLSKVAGAVSGKICTLMSSPFRLWVLFAFHPADHADLLEMNFYNLHVERTAGSLLSDFPFYRLSPSSFSSLTGFSGVWVLVSQQHLVLSSLLSRVK